MMDRADIVFEDSTTLRERTFATLTYEVRIADVASQVERHVSQV
jgi:hypothetical protein